MQIELIINNVLLFLIFLSLILNLFISFKNKKQSIEIKKIDLTEVEKAKQFLDKIIKDKFEYYLVTEILPLYKIGKTLDKNQVNELKEQFFIDVSYFINKDLKNILKSYFNKEAIKIYIIEKFFIYLNKVDMSFFEEINLNEKDFEKMIKD